MRETKRKKWVCNSRISNKKDQIKEEIKQRIKDIQKSPTAQNALLFNALVLGVHNYFRYATHINLDLNRMNYVLSFTTYNRLSNCSTRCYPNKASPTYKKFYSTTMKTYKVAGVYLYPLCDVSTKQFTDLIRRIHRLLRLVVKDWSTKAYSLLCSKN